MNIVRRLLDVAVRRCHRALCRGRIFHCAPAVRTVRSALPCLIMFSEGVTAAILSWASIERTRPPLDGLGCGPKWCGLHRQGTRVCVCVCARPPVCPSVQLAPDSSQVLFAQRHHSTPRWCEAAFEVCLSAVLCFQSDLRSSNHILLLFFFFCCWSKAAHSYWNAFQGRRSPE